MKNKRIIAIIIGVVLFTGVVGEHVFPSFPEHVSQQVKKEHKFALINEALASPTEYPKLAKRAKDIQKFQSSQQTTTSFYGKIEDQHGDPVAGATITGYRTYYPMIPNLDFSRSAEELSLTSDENGQFSIVDKKINSLAILKIAKSGFEIQANKTYVLSQGGYKLIQSFSDPEKPVIFHAWKKTEAESLVHDILEVGYRPDGKFYRVRLKGVEEQLKISFIVDPKGTNSNSLDWSMKLKVIDGGLIESTDKFMNEAPLGGYMSNLSYEYKKDNKDFSDDIRKKFYLKARNGQVYGRLECRIHPYYNDIVAVDIKYWLNPNGSRNLQYDRSKRIQ
jgi:hypothetical protein